MNLRTIINCKNDLFRYCVGISFAAHCVALAFWSGPEHTVELAVVAQPDVASRFVEITPPPKVEPKVEPKPAVAQVKSRAKVEPKRRSKRRVKRRSKRRTKRRAHKRVAKRRTTPKVKRTVKQTITPSATPAVAAIKTETHRSPVVATAQPTLEAKGSDVSTSSERASSVTQRLSRGQIRGILKGYYRSLNALMRQGKNYPRSARRLKLEGTVLVELVVNQRGEILKVKVARSSGHQVLDRAALAQVQKIKRVPGIPRAVNRPSMTFHIPFEYRLQS